MQLGTKLSPSTDRLRGPSKHHRSHHVIPKTNPIVFPLLGVLLFVVQLSFAAETLQSVRSRETSTEREFDWEAASTTSDEPLAHQRDVYELEVDDLLSTRMTTGSRDDYSSQDTMVQKSSILESYFNFRRANPTVRLAAKSPFRKSSPLPALRPLSPVILVPGYGGSRLEARINKTQAKHYICERHTDWTNIWIDLKLMLPYMIDCLIEDFRLEFDPRTNTTHNTEGVEIRVRKPNDLATVEYLTNLHLSSFGYFAAIIRKLTKAYGYERNVNIRGAPYDFRKSPNELGEFFEQLKSTCEQMYEQSGHQPVSFVCHSMGCNNVLYLLQRQSQAWKDKYIRRVVSLAAPWGGSMQALRATAFGDNLGMPYLFDEAELRIVQQSVPSTMYLFPNERAFKDAPIVKTNVLSLTGDLIQTSSNKIDDGQADGPFQNESVAKRYSGKREAITAHDFKPFFDAINHPDGYLMWLNTKDLLRSLEAPGVEVNCLYGRGHSTLARMDFDGEFPDSRERDYYADGDGTVAVQSSAAVCSEWAKEQKQPVMIKPFYANHVDMMKDPEVLDAIEAIMGQA